MRPNDVYQSIHQSTIWYYLGDFQISKVKQKAPNLMSHWFHKTLPIISKHFLCFVSGDLAS